MPLGWPLRLAPPAHDDAKTRRPLGAEDLRTRGIRVHRSRSGMRCGAGDEGSKLMRPNDEVGMKGQMTLP